MLEKKIWDKVSVGDTLAYVHSNKEENIEEAIEKVKEAYSISEKEPERYVDILNII